jgi:hypothetical protein
MKRINPYSNLGETKFWKNYISNKYLSEILGTEGLNRFQIPPESRIMTMGSCFAQHVSNYLKTQGDNYYVTEFNSGNKNKNFIDIKNGYGIFTARYGNIYNLKQANQLIRNAVNSDVEFGEIWKEIIDGETRFIDSIRPNAIPNGFATTEKLIEDREFHYKKVNEAIVNSEVLILTLGLTEGWVNSETEQYYQIAPGVRYGNYKAQKHMPFNLSVFECISELNEFIIAIRRMNENIKIILTVSPIPLAATHQKENVLIASSLAKTKLRLAIDEVEKKNQNIYYFPSFELINNLSQAGKFFEPNLRDLKKFAITNVMDIFRKSYFLELTSNKKTVSNSYLQDKNKDVLCDEDLIFKINGRTDES